MAALVWRRLATVTSLPTAYTFLLCIQSADLTEGFKHSPQPYIYISKGTLFFNHAFVVFVERKSKVRVNRLSEGACTQRQAAINVPLSLLNAK